MVLDIEPVAHVLARAVNRQRLAIQCVEDDQRDELFREMVRPVIVRAVGKHDRQAIGLVPGAHEMVARRLARRIGGRGRVGRGFAEQAVVEIEVAEDLVGRDMVETERVFLRAFESAPVFQRRVEQAEGAHHIGFHESAGAVDRAVDMAFGRQVHDPVDLLFAQQAQHQLAVEDIAFHQPVVRRIVDGLEAFRIARIGQLVEIDDALAGAHQLADDRRSDEAGAAGDENGIHGQLSKAKGVVKSAKAGAASSFSDRVGAQPISGHSMARSGSSQRIAPSASLL